MIQCSVWENQKNLKCIFPVISIIPSVEMERVHPLQQENVCRIRRKLQGDYRVVSIVLFGSSVNLRCTLRSDLDLAVRLYDEFVNRETKNEVSEKIQEACDWSADILWYDRLKYNLPKYIERSTNCMSKLLARAKVKYNNAKNDYEYIGIDDAYLDDCCYNL